jgi:putative DNA primase/helicase
MTADDRPLGDVGEIPKLWRDGAVEYRLERERKERATRHQELKDGNLSRPEPPRSLIRELPPAGRDQGLRRDGHGGRREGGNAMTSAPSGPAIPGERDNANATNDDAEIARLAKLPPLVYDRQRKAAADKLGIDRIRVLDDAVTAARVKIGDAKGHGRAPSIADVEPWPEPVNLADALDKAAENYSRYLILPAGGAEKIALWSMGTHCFQCFPIFPRLATTSADKECAKSLLLRVLKCTSARAVIMTNANIAPLFRMISVCRPSIFLDEADNYLGEKPELLALLNDGYAAGGRVWRCEGENNEVKEFDVFAPVAFAMINRPTDTLLSRSIEIRMVRKKREENTANFRGDRVAPELLEIQRKFARAAADHADALRVADPDMESLFNRDADNWRPMFAIADIAGREWPRRIREIAQAAVAARAEQSTREKLLADIRWILDGKPEERDGKTVTEYGPVDRMSSADLADHLSKIDGRPWGEWKAGRPISPAALARQLGAFGILSGTIRLDGGHTLKGYKRADFSDAFERYLVPHSVTPSQPNGDGHCDALQNVTTGSHVTLSKALQPNNDGHCDVVTDRKEEGSAKGMFGAERITESDDF